MNAEGVEGRAREERFNNAQEVLRKAACAGLGIATLPLSVPASDIAAAGCCGCCPSTRGSAVG